MSKQPAASSAASGKQAFISFAPQLLGAEPVRLPVLSCQHGLLALNLPGGLAADADPLNPDGTRLLAQALREQLAASKPELLRLGMKSVQSIFNLEPQMSGVALFATSRHAGEQWRNTYGSELLRLRFLLICERAADLPDVIECSLPIARHSGGGRMLVSHKSGKKTFTRFRRLALAEQPKGRHNPFFEKELWEAEVTYMRPHQIRLHAFEVGLRVCGEDLYAQVPSFCLSELKGLRRRPTGEEPLWSGPMIHLSQIEPVDAAVLAGVAAEVDAGAGGLSASYASVVMDEENPEDAEINAGRAAAAAPSQWPICAALPRPLALASRLLFGEQAATCQIAPDGTDSEG